MSVREFELFQKMISEEIAWHEKYNAKEWFKYDTPYHVLMNCSDPKEAKRKRRQKYIAQLDEQL